MFCFFENFGMRIECTFVTAGYVTDHNSCKGTITLYQFNNFAKKQISIVALWMNNIHQIHSFRGASLFTSANIQEQELHSPGRSVLEEDTGMGQSSAGKRFSAKAECKTTLKLPFFSVMLQGKTVEVGWFSFYSVSNQSLQTAKLFLLVLSCIIFINKFK